MRRFYKISSTNSNIREKIEMKKKRLLCILILIVIVLIINPIYKKNKALAEPIIQPQQIVSSEKGLHLQAFVDRTKIKVDETIIIRVWLESELIDSATVSIFYVKEKIEPQGTSHRTVSLPMKVPIIFSFTGKDFGNTNVFIHASGINQKNNQSITSSQQISGIEVQEPVKLWSGLISNPLAGVIVGALLTFGIALLNDFSQRSREKAQRKHWVLATLPAQLTTNCIAVNREEKAQFETWESKLLTEGYYTELQDLAGRKHNQKEIARMLVEVSFDLRTYEQHRTQKRLTKEEKENLENKLVEIVNSLEALRQA